MTSTHFRELLTWTVFSVTVIMVEVLRGSVKKIMVCIINLKVLFFFNLQDLS